MTSFPDTGEQAWPLFVYGTLRPGGVYWAEYCAGRVAVVAPEAWVYGRLYALPEGYPGLTLGADRVYGTVLALQDTATLARIDELEDFVPDRPAADNLYDRRLAPWYFPGGESGGLAWVYVMEVTRALGMNGEYLPAGRWP
jgi:gamma-glutamylcyclotransferase (GGCT)/AIG2-like uncharacterized protein YtfP